MIPTAALLEGAHRRTENAESRDLRAYLKAEYRADLPWLHAQLKRSRARKEKGGRLWRLLTRKAREKRGGKAREGWPVVPPEERAGDRDRTTRLASGNPAACDHLVVEDLGDAGSASFARCLACGILLIAHDGRLWTLRSKLRGARPSALGREAPSADGRESDLGSPAALHV